MLSLVVLGGAWPGMVTVETIGRIRRAFWVDKKPIRQIVRELRISRQTVRKAIRGTSTEFATSGRFSRNRDWGLCRTA